MRKLNLIKKTALILAILPIITIAGCSCGSSSSKSTGEANINKTFKSPGSPLGNDAISASTNQSSKDEETSPKLNGLAGAGFIQAPQINNYGSVSMSYPVEVAPGRHGMQPSVGISYSSSGGDGLVGIGWNLSSGTGAVSRTTRNGQLYYDQRDTFTYNGKRLVKISGPSGSEEGIYRLEIESGFAKLELSDIAGGGVWTVYDKAGTVTIYGETKESRIYQPDNINKTYTWNFTRSTDLNGNFMEALYDNSEYGSNHISYIKEVRYTGNSTAGLPARQYVRFHYKKREDTYVSRAPGFIMTMERLVDYIEVGWDSPDTGANTELWRYSMQYENSEDSNRPLLTGIESTRNTTRPEFIYQPASHQFVWKSINNPNHNDSEINPAATRYFEGDFNGDGISDMVFFNPETGYWKAAEARRDGGYNFKTYASRFQGYDSDDKIRFFKGNLTGDFNGDGKSDIAMYLPETKEFWVAQHNGEIFNFINYGKLNIDVDIFKCEWFPGDYDGNGLSDSVLFDEASGDWILMRNMGGSFTFFKFGNYFQNLFREDFIPGLNLNSTATTDDSLYGKSRSQVHFLNGDFNGNGRTDISIYDARSGRWYVGENIRIDDNTNIDFKLEWKLYKEFTLPEKALFGHDRFSGDFNGDGLSDFLVFDRAEGEWWIGETGNNTISFRMFSRTPEFKEVTRFLQGDFNGDGRTDIGFFSKSDNNFWIGESTPNGFRYRIYNNLESAPDAARIMAAPLPEDEVKLSSKTHLVSSSGFNTILDYAYNANYYQGKGEQVFTGNFEGDKAGLVIFNKADGKLSYASTGQSVSESGLYLDQSNSVNTFLNSQKPVSFNDKDALLYYTKESSLIGSDTHKIELISFTGSLTKSLIAEFDNSVVKNFSSSSFHLFDRFAVSDCLLVLDDQKDVPDFKLFTSDGSPQTLTISGSLSAASLKNCTTRKTRYRFFSGNFTAAGTSQILIVDMSTSTHRYYLGTIGTGQVSFVLLNGNPTFYTDGNTGNFFVKDNFIVYEAKSGDSSQFHKLEIGSSIVQYSYTPLGQGNSFKGEFTFEGGPVVYNSGGTFALRLSGSSLSWIRLSDALSGLANFKIERPDLMQDIYALRWIQGDYNGDGKTDLGFFHLKESSWYFLMTTGTVPDLIYKVNNGIGGLYNFEYANSTSFDNTGEDNIPDLPMNYKVCTRLTIDDGTGQRIVSKYAYKGGYAFSDFINGYKETDYFGFSEFHVIDAAGAEKISYYHTTPYADFRKNRALSGAVKEESFIGHDKKEYSKTTYQYKVHEIIPAGRTAATSFLIEPVEKISYSRSEKTKALVKTSTTRSNIVLTPGEYEMVSTSESVTDHYTDSIHSETTLTSYTEFENIAATNEMRPLYKKALNGTSHETTTNYTYDSRGNLTEERTAYTGTGLAAVTDRLAEYEYDSLGNRVRSTNKSGTPYRVSETDYDNILNQFTVETRSIKESGSLTEKFAIDYGAAFGAVTEKTDANNNKTYFDYDSYGRLASQRIDTEGGTETLNSYTYQNSSFPYSGRVVQYTGTDDQDIVTRLYYDGMGRILHSVSSATNSATRRYVKSGRLVYDYAGRVIRKSQTSWAADDEIDTFRINSRDKYPTITEYDAAGRVAKVTAPKTEGETKETSTVNIYHSPWETESVHSVGRSKLVTTNSRGQVLYIEEKGTGDDSQPISAKLGFAYDLAGRRIKKMDLNSASMDLSINTGLLVPGAKDNSGNNIALWEYDGFGQVVKSYDPDFGYSAAEYTGFGQLKNSTDALNRVTHFTYDMLGRLTTKELPGTEGEVHYYYDEMGGSENALGRVTLIDDTTQKKQFSYDMAGRVKKEIRQIKVADDSSHQYVTEFKHDLLDRLTQVDYPDATNVSNPVIAFYSYIPMGVKRVYINNGTADKDIITNTEYNEFGQIERVDRGNGNTSYYSYDIKGRLKNLQTTAYLNETYYKLQDVEYTFKVDNSIKQLTDSRELEALHYGNSSVTYTYQYDGLNRLVHAAGTYSSALNSADNKKYERAFGYAANGNLLKKDIINPETHVLQNRWDYTYSNHAATGIDTTQTSNRFTMQYDAVGNMIFQSDIEKNVVKESTFDSQNRITQVTNGSSETIGSYWYDDQGFRVRKIGKKNFDGVDGLIEVLYPSMYFGLEKQRDADGTLVPNTEYAINNIYLNGIRIAAVMPDGTAQYYLTDQVDSVKVVTDDGGIPVTNTEYLPYGESWFQRGTADNAPKYNSQELDKETGYYFYNARYYDGEIGRFVTPDTVIDGEDTASGWNRYMYCAGNPVLYKDPTGHWVDQSETHYIKDSEKNINAVNFARGTVTKGDNLWKIAEETLKKELKYKLIKGKPSNKAIKKKVDFIKKLNELKTDNLKEGQKLITGIHGRLVKSDGIEQGSLVVDMAMIVTGGGFVKNGIKGIQKGLAKATAQAVGKKGAQKLILRSSGKFAKHTFTNLAKGLVKASSKKARKMVLEKIIVKSKAAVYYAAPTTAAVAEAISGMSPFPPTTGKEAIGALIKETFNEIQEQIKRKN